MNTAVTLVKIAYSKVHAVNMAIFAVLETYVLHMLNKSRHAIEVESLRAALPACILAKSIS